MAKLGAECLFYTSLGDDETGRRAGEALERIGVRVLAAVRAAPQTRALSAAGEVPDRAIAVIGAAASARIEDALPWDELAGCDAAYFTGHDSATLEAARRARRLVVTSRRLPSWSRAASAPTCSWRAPPTRRRPLTPTCCPCRPGPSSGPRAPPAATGRATTGAPAAGTPWSPPGRPSTATAAATPSSPALTVGLARGLDLDGALHLGARCGAQCITGRGGLGPSSSRTATKPTTIAEYIEVAPVAGQRARAQARMRF